MASLERDKWENVILRFRVGGRGTPELRENLGPMTVDDARAEADKIVGRWCGTTRHIDPRIIFSALADSYVTAEAPRLSDQDRALLSRVVLRHLRPLLRAGHSALREDRPGCLSGSTGPPGI